MNVLRPVQPTDLEQIYNLSAHTKVGLTTLPHDREFLRHRIEEADHNFKFPPKKPGGEVFMLVLENLETESVIGTCAVFTKVGGFEPSWTYELKTMVNKSDVLKVEKEIQYLQLKADHNGPSEIGTLFLSPDHREGLNGRMLSLGRFLFMAQHLHFFEDNVVAEMRGRIDENGKSVFWRALGKHFFDVTLQKADLMVNKDKKFIADLMPVHPIYVPLLPEAAQEVIGRTHPDTKPARCLLEQEGFEFINEIDIFEAGPVLGCEVKKIRAINENVFTKVGEISDVDESKDTYLISRVGKPSDYRLCHGQLIVSATEDITINKETANALQVEIGDQITYSPIKAKK